VRINQGVSATGQSLVQDPIARAGARRAWGRLGRQASFRHSARDRHFVRLFLRFRYRGRVFTFKGSIMWRFDPISLNGRHP